MDIDIEALVASYLDHRLDTARYASFDYCYNYFQESHEQAGTSQLAKDDGLTQLIDMVFFQQGRRHPTSDLDA